MIRLTECMLSSLGVWGLSKLVNVTADLFYITKHMYHYREITHVEKIHTLLLRVLSFTVRDCATQIKLYKPTYVS